MEAKRYSPAWIQARPLCLECLLGNDKEDRKKVTGLPMVWFSGKFVCLGDKYQRSTGKDSLAGQTGKKGS